MRQFTYTRKLLNMKIPNTFYEVSIASGATEIINVSGRYLRVVACPDNFEMRINEVGAAFPVYNSFYLRTDDDLSRLTITNNGTSTGKIQFYVAADEVGDNITSSMSVSGSVDCVPALKLVRIMRYTGAASISLGTVMNPNMKSVMIRNEGITDLSLGYAKSPATFTKIAAGDTLCLDTQPTTEFTLVIPANSAVSVLVFA